MKRRARTNPGFQDFKPEDWKEFLGHGKQEPLPYAPLGSISEGTLRPEDLVEAFSETLRELMRFGHPSSGSSQNYSQLLRDSRRLLDSYEMDGDDDDELAELIPELEDALGDFAPPYAYFGTAEGDGAAFGYWVDLEQVNSLIVEARRHPDEDSGILAVEDTDDVPDDFIGEVFYVSDHGNITLYRCSLGELREIWSIV